LIKTFTSEKSAVCVCARRFALKALAYYKARPLSHFSFDTAGAKEKLSKENAVWEFRALRSAANAPRRLIRAAF
jgi:hypothetical protein